jgi:predicted transcriptional regulator YheO
MAERRYPLDGGREAAIQACVALFYPHVEVVLHDVRRDRVVAIWNSFSDRRVGSPSLLEPTLVAGLAEGEVIGPYTKVEADGRSITSVSVPIDGNTLLLCYNFDRSVIDQAVDSLTRFAGAVQPQSRALFELDWRDGINELIDMWCRQHDRQRARLSRADRVQIISVLDSKGYFSTRHATAHVARALDVSRATVYAILKEVRG